MLVDRDKEDSRLLTVNELAATDRVTHRFAYCCGVSWRSNNRDEQSYDRWYQQVRR